MSHAKNALLLTAALLGGGFASTTFAQEAAPVSEAAQEVEQTFAATGKLVVPEELPVSVKPEQIDMTKLSGTLMWLVPGQPNPYPEDFEEMTDEQKKAWVEAFKKSPELIEYQKAMRVWQLEQQKQRPMSVAFEANGSFRFEGLKPGEYLLSASIPHPNSKTSPVAAYKDKVEVKAEVPVAELGEIPMEIYAYLVPGDMAPNFTAQHYDGTTFQLSDYRGKYVLLDFWATWCGPCIGEIPNLNAVHKAYAGEQFELISLSLDKNIELPKKFHEERPSPYVHGYLGEWNKTETTGKAYGVRGIPSLWLIGPDGKIVARDLRGKAIGEAVKKALQGEEEFF